MRAQETIEPLIGRSGAALTLAGSALFAIGGADEYGAAGAALAIDVFAGTANSLALGLPTRTGARVALATDQPALLMVGGQDSTGTSHDDVWVVEGSLATGFAEAKLLRPDSVDAGSFSGQDTVVLGAI